MSGRALLRKVSKAIEDFGGDEWFMDRVASGARMDEIADEIGLCSRPYLYNWIKAGGEKRQEAYKEARRFSSYAKDEEGEKILADCKADTAQEVTLASSRAKYCQWQAEVRNRAEFGSKAGDVNVNLSVGALHLDALRLRAPAPSPGRAVAVPVEDAPVEIVGAETE